MNHIIWFRYHFRFAFWCEFNLQNTFTAIGKDLFTTYLRGRIHLTDITGNYKKDKNLLLEENTNGDESDPANDASAEKEFKTYDPSKYNIEIRDDGSIPFCYPRQNHMSAIASVDYAMRETKPSCGFVKEFKIIWKLI